MNSRMKRRARGELGRRKDRAEEQIVVFRLGGEDYGIEISQVREIIKKRSITPMPRQPAYVEGVINVRGTIIPVVNLRKRFGLTGDELSEPHTIIVESGDGLVGILVDSVSEVIRLPQDRIHPPPPVSIGVDSEYLRGICRVGDRLLVYLDVEKVVKTTPTTAYDSAAREEMQEETMQESLMTTS
jgi:purine-binding chemotaxis protein CheW